MFCCPGAKPPTGILFNIPTLSLYKKSRKEMASLGENGQEYKCPFFKSAREILQKTSPKTPLLAYCSEFGFFGENIGCTLFLSILWSKGFRKNLLVGYILNG
jgi:hypothetical protein